MSEHEHETEHERDHEGSLQSERALRRARQAVRCLPFRLAFYRDLDVQARSSSQIAADPEWQRLSRHQLSANRTEDLLIWLIQLGVLRREVDGQGLTERVRLTPLGRRTIAIWLNASHAADAIPTAGPLTRLRHWLRRHRPRL